MTPQDHLAQAQQQSVALYLQRQQIEAQRQQLAQQAQDIDLQLMRLDGVIEAWTQAAREAVIAPPLPLAEGSHGE